MENKEDVKNPFDGFNIISVRSDATKEESTTKKVEASKPDNQEDKKEPQVNLATATVATPSKKEEKVVKKSEEEEVEEVIKKQTEVLKKDKKSENTEIKEEETVESDEDDSVFKPFIEHLANQGIVQYDPEKFEDSEEGVANVIAQTIKSEVEAYKQSKSDEVQKFIEFTDNGGNPKDFLDVYYGNVDYSTFKIDTEENQKLVIREGLKAAGWEETEIEEELKDYEDLGKLETKAKVHLTRLQKEEAETKETLVKQQKEAQEQQKKAQLEYFENLKKDWHSKEEIKGFKLTPKLKDAVWNHMTKPVDRSGLTQLAKNNQTNTEAQFLYAYLDYINWDISKLEKQVKTKVVSTLQDKLRNFTDSRGKAKLSHTHVDKPANENNPFEGFDMIKV